MSAADPQPAEGRLYPPDAERGEMRKVLLSHLRRHPAEYTASVLVDGVRSNGGGGFSERDLRLELSRMLGSQVRMNPNRTLSAR